MNTNSERSCLGSFEDYPTFRLPLITHLLAHVARTGTICEPSIIPLREHTKTSASKLIGLPSAEHINTSLVRSLSFCHFAPAIRQVQRVFHIINHPSWDSKLFFEQWKSLQHCAEMSCAIVKIFGSNASIIVPLSICTAQVYSPQLVLEERLFLAVSDI